MPSLPARTPSPSWSVRVSIFSAVLLAGLRVTGVNLDLPAWEAFHPAIELSQFVIPLLVFASTRAAGPRVLGDGLVAAAILDVLHGVAFLGLPALTTEEGWSASAWFWLAARLLDVLAIVRVAWPRPSIHPAVRTLGILGIVLAMSHVLLVARPTLAPLVTGAGVPTPLGRTLLLVFASGSAAFAVWMRRRPPGISPWAVPATVAIAAAAAASAIQERIGDLPDLAAHLYIATAYGFLYRMAPLAALAPAPEPSFVTPLVRVADTRLATQVGRRTWRLTIAFAVVTGIATVATAGGFLYLARDLEQTTVAQLRAVNSAFADFAAAAVRENQSDLRFIADRGSIRAALAEPGPATDAQALATLEAAVGLEGFRRAYLSDAGGQVRVATDQDPPPPALAAAIRRVVERGEVEFVDLSELAPRGPRHAVAGPVRSPGPAGGVIGALVLEIEDGDGPIVATRQGTATRLGARSALFKRDGGAVRYLGGRGWDTAPAEANGEPSAALQILRGAPGVAVRGRDREGRTVLAVGAPIAGTPWYILTQVELDRVLVGTRRTGVVLGIVYASFLTLLAGLVRVLSRTYATEYQRQVAEMGRNVRLATDQSPVAIALVRPDGGTEYENPAWAARSAGWVGPGGAQPDADLDEAHAKELAAALADGRGWRGLVHRPDGRWEQVAAAPVRDEAASVVLRLWTIEDVTGATRAREALDRFFDQPTSLNLILTPDGRIAKANAGWLALGYDPSQLEGALVDAVLHEADRPGARRARRRLVPGGAVVAFELRVQRTDGSPRWVRGSASAGAEGWIYAIASDVTEARAAEQDAVARAARSRALLDLQHLAEGLPEPRVIEVAEGLIGRFTGGGPVKVGVGAACATPADGGRIQVQHAGEVVLTVDVGEARPAEGAPETETIRLLAQETWRMIQHLRMVEALQASESRFSAVFEQASVGIAIITPGGRIEHANRRFCELLGRPLEDLCRLSVQDITHPEDFPADAVGIAAVLEGKQPFHAVEKRYLLPDGTELWAQLSAAPLRDAGGTPVLMLAIVQDIQARRAAEAELRKLALAVEQTPESIVITDRESRIEYVNRAFERTSGFSAAEVLGQNPRILQSGETSPAVFAGLRAALAAGETWTGEFRNRRRDGSIYTELAAIAPVRQLDGTITHYVGVKQDVTEAKRIEAELVRYRHHLEEMVEQRTQELLHAKRAADAANQAKSLFLANMSHELRTPMNAMLGLSHLLRRELRDPVQVARLEQLSQAGHHLLGILNDVLDLSKIDADRLEIVAEDFVLSELVESAAGMVRATAVDKGLALRLVPSRAPEWLRGDAPRLRQSLVNYLGNAVKFASTGTVSVRVDVAEEGDADLLLRFQVEDQGPGIAAEDLGRLFEPFEQLDASVTRRHGGTGLGLAITRRLARRMGGDAGVQSVLGEGATFWFTARVGRAAPRRVVTPVDAEALLRDTRAGCRVLLAEDNAVNREVAIALLRGVGLVVDTAADGDEAVRQATARVYDVVLMDLQMPGVGGLEATRRILAAPGRADTVVVALTAHAFAEERVRCVDGGMRDFVVKPADPRELYEVLLRWLPERSSAEVLDPTAAAAFDGETEWWAAVRRFAARGRRDLERAMELERGGEGEAAGAILAALIEGAARLGAGGVRGSLTALEVGPRTPRRVAAASRAFEELGGTEGAAAPPS